MKIIKKFFVRDVNMPEGIESNDKVSLHSSYYNKIFGKKFHSDGYLPWKRGIVKIIFGTRIINRMFWGENIKGDEIGLSNQSKILLELTNETDEYEFTLCKGSKFFFYWQHPLHYVRVSFKLGMLSVILGVIGVVLTIVK